MDVLILILHLTSVLWQSSEVDILEVRLCSSPVSLPVPLFSREQPGSCSAWISAPLTQVSHAWRAWGHGILGVPLCWAAIRGLIKLWFALCPFFFFPSLLLLSSGDCKWDPCGLQRLGTQVVMTYTLSALLSTLSKRPREKFLLLKGWIVVCCWRSTELFLGFTKVWLLCCKN